MISFSLEKLTDLERHKTIFATTWSVVAAVHPDQGLIVLAIVFCCAAYRFRISSPRRPLAIALLVTIALMMGGYYYAYVFTPYQLKWLVWNSTLRLWMQVWPIVVLAGCMLLRDNGARDALQKR